MYCWLLSASSWSPVEEVVALAVSRCCWLLLVLLSADPCRPAAGDCCSAPTSSSRRRSGLTLDSCSARFAAIYLYVKALKKKPTWQRVFNLCNEKLCTFFPPKTCWPPIIFVYFRTRDRSMGYVRAKTCGILKRFSLFNGRACFSVMASKSSAIACPCPMCKGRLVSGRTVRKNHLAMFKMGDSAGAASSSWQAPPDDHEVSGILPRKTPASLSRRIEGSDIVFKCDG